MNGFEKVFIIFAAAFALEEYTASKEHGWTSESPAIHFRRAGADVYPSLHSECESYASSRVEV